MLALTNGFASFLHSFFAFLIILVPLVVFHEFGHFVFAKIFGVKAEIFSIGFGPTLWSRQMGETELRVSAIPMGGYVKLLGEDRDTPLSEAEQKRALHKQKPWKRFFIFFGGPLFNFLLAIFIFMAILAIGEPQVANVIGRVVHGSVAEKVGFQSGDHILAIDHKPIKKYEEVVIALNESPGRNVDFEVLHPKSKNPTHIQVKTSSQTGFSIYGESTAVGEVEGMLPLPRANLVGVSNPKSVAAQAGIETGDKIVSLNQRPILTWEEMDSIYSEMTPGTQFEIQFQKAKTGEIKSLTWEKPKFSQGESNALPKTLEEVFGLHSSELFIDKTVPKSPAEVAGLKYGDRLLRVGGQEVQSFFELKDAVQKSGEKEGKVQLFWERGGRIYSSMITPTITTGRDPILNKTTQYTVGVIPLLTLAEPVTFIERVWNPFKLVYQATDRMITLSWRNLVSLKKMVTGDVSMGSLGGPIMIGKIAGESLTRGLIAFLTNMAIFSIGLGVLNILPVPVLDGGHLLLLGVESIRGKPLTLRQMEVVQGVGLILILTLMGIAFRNDLARLFYS